MVRVTSQPKSHLFDVEISEWRRAGLVLPSVARLNKLATLEKALVARTLGKLEPVDHKAVAGVLSNLFAAWS